MHYQFDLYGRFAGTSETATDRSTEVAPDEMTPDWNWNGVNWVFAPNIQTAPTISQASLVEQQTTIVAGKIDALWKAADTYTSSYISGVAIGLLTLGVIQQLPKAMAVTQWSSSIWDAYYERKALVTVDSQDDLDFSSFGPIPHTVPELRAELGL